MVRERSEMLRKNPEGIERNDTAGIFWGNPDAAAKMAAEEIQNTILRSYIQKKSLGNIKFPGFFERRRPDLNR